MQSGFAMLEVGVVRAKNAQNILLKNLFDVCIGALLWWLLGFGFAFGESASGFIGTSEFGATTKYAEWMFQFAFSATAATIVSGALAGRTAFPAYALFSVFITAFIYPVIVHWTWGGGWLSTLGFTDFAGSGIVHLTGGIAALTGAHYVGKRLGRFEDNDEQEFRPHNMPLVVMGTLILWFGWYGFNAGSTLGITDGNTSLAGLVAMNTTISAAIAGLVTFIFRGYFFQQLDPRFNVSAISNGILAGLVSITAPCGSVEPWAAFCIGAVGGFVYIGSSYLVQKKLHIDDPLDAFAVHGGCGIWGTLSVAFFDSSKGIFYGAADSGKFLGIQLLGILVIMLWTFTFSALTFASLKHFNLLRVSQEVERLGLDRCEHGGSAYELVRLPSPKRRQQIEEAETQENSQENNEEKSEDNV
jgi:Amt family ammonium transporter